MATPKEQIAQYSTQLVYTTSTAPTYLSLLNGIDLELPNAVASSDKIKWMNDAVRDVYKWVASTNYGSTTLTSAQAIYSLPTDARFDKLKAVMVSDSTARSSTEHWAVYVPCGEDEELSGNQYFKAGGGVGVFPVPTTDDTGKGLLFKYEQVPTAYGSTTDTTSVPDLDLDYVNIIGWKTKQRIARAGNNPDVELANNLQYEIDELIGKMRMAYYKRKQTVPQKRISYKEGFWNG
ncbi:MAG: hypothetical protein WC749_02355 [Dehalococcoidia bacterium]